MKKTSSLSNISTRLQQIAELSGKMPDAVLTTLSHHIDLLWLRESYRLTRKQGALGIDGKSAQDYANNLETNLQSLLNRAKSGRYRAPSVKRVHIPKGDGKQTRPIGIPTFEDKVLQRAVAMLLGAVYEESFYDFSYGFRHQRSAHNAVKALGQHLMRKEGGWVLEVDVRKFFDHLDHKILRDIIRQRVGDGVILRLIDKWLNAGVVERGELSYPQAGTPQGGVISPILANIYLHEVLDRWFVQEVRPRLRGRAEVVRYADDFVLIFEHEQEARRVFDVLPERFGRYGLTLHPDKTRLTDLRRPNHRSGEMVEQRRKRSLDMLGFTFYWGRSKRGRWIVKVKTASERFSRALQRTAQWCRLHRHDRIVEQYEALSKKLRGHYAYYGVTFNSAALASFRYQVERVWKKWLSRRSRSSAASNNWEWMAKVLRCLVLPRPRIVHSLIT